MEKKISPYLIQRARFKNGNAENTGFDAILRFDYMGSAEFEFGALSKSLHRMVADCEKYSMIQFDQVKTGNNMPMFIFANMDNIEAIKDAAIHLSQNKYGYKERCDMPDYIKEGLSTLHRNNFWWDIENDYMICFGKEYSDRVEEAMGKMVEKWTNTL